MPDDIFQPRNKIYDSLTDRQKIIVELWDISQEIASVNSLIFSAKFYKKQYPYLDYQSIIRSKQEYLKSLKRKYNLLKNKRDIKTSEITNQSITEKMKKQQNKSPYQTNLFRNKEQTLQFLHESDFNDLRYEGRIKMIKNEHEEPTGFVYNRLDEEVDCKVQMWRKYLKEDENTNNDLIMFENMTWGLEEADLITPGQSNFETGEDTKDSLMSGGSMMECEDDEMLTEDVEQYKYNDIYGTGENAEEDEIESIDNRHDHSDAKEYEGSLNESLKDSLNEFIGLEEKKDKHKKHKKKDKEKNKNTKEKAKRTTPVGFNMNLGKGEDDDYDDDYDNFPRF